MRNAESVLRVERNVGPPALLGLRPRFMDRVMVVMRQDERVRGLALWGSLARGDADEWSDVDYVLTVPDEHLASFAEELGQENSALGRSLVAVSTPQDGVEGGDLVSVTYLRSGLPLHVDWYVCPSSMGLPIDTKPLIARDGWPQAGATFAELRSQRPSTRSSTPKEADLAVSMIPVRVKEVARGRPEAVVIDGSPAKERIEAYAALSRQISALSAEYADVRPPLYAYLGIARQHFR